MSPGEVLMSGLEFDVESISVRKGCSLNVYTGSRLTGDNHLFHGSTDDMHITFDEDEKLEKFDDNVNSAICSCVNPVWKYYQFHGARFYQAPFYHYPRYFYPVQYYGGIVGKWVLI